MPEIEHRFAFMIRKRLDPTTKKIGLKLQVKSEGLPIAEAILILEGWVAAEKKKMLDPLFQQNGSE